MTNAGPTLDVLWKAEEFSPSIEAFEEFKKSYIALLDHYYSNSKPFSLFGKGRSKVMRFLNEVSSLEIMLGLNGIYNTSVVFHGLDG